MNNNESQEIVNRFFEALDALKESGEIRGEQTFSRKHGINRRNLYFIRNNPSSGMFQPAWLSHLVTDHGVSAKWLLTGCGRMLSARKKKKPVPQRRGGAR